MMFDEMYEIAIKSNDFETLAEGLAEFNLDTAIVIGNYEISLAALLATKVDDDRAGWLVKLGVNVYSVVYIYAFNKDCKKVDECYARYNLDAAKIANIPNANQFSVSMPQ